MFKNNMKSTNGNETVKQTSAKTNTQANKEMTKLITF